MAEFIASERIHEFSTCFGTNVRLFLRDDTADFNNASGILLADEYNFKAIPFEDGDVVVDIGAHIGSASLLLASLGLPNMRILAYEPLPENVELIRENAKLNGFNANIVAFEFSVSDKIKTLDIQYGDESTVSGRHHHFIGNAFAAPVGRVCKSSAVSLAWIFENAQIEHCKLVKIDPEGEELAILQACPKEVFSRIDYLVGEHHFQKREEILAATKGVFDDMPCPHQSDTALGHFWFKRKTL